LALSKDDIKKLLDRHRKMERDRGVWDNHYQNLAEIFQPWRASFTRQISEGQQYNLNYDSAPMLARRGLSSAIDGLLKPKTTKWFNIRPYDRALAEDDESKRWIADAEERLWRAIYNPKARFIERSGEVDDDLVTFGTGCLFIGSSTDGLRLLFKSYHMKRVYIQENADGLVDTIHVVLSFTARQAAQKWKQENLGDKVKEALKEDRNKDQKFEFLWVVKPRYDRDMTKRDNKNFPFADYVLGIDDENIVAESGHYEFPFAVPRWDTSTEELYGRSPAMLALPDGNTLQAMAKTLLTAGQKAADPSLLVANDSVVGIIRTYPGGITYFDPETTGNRDPITAVKTGANIPLSREMQADVRDQIWVAFFRDVLRLPFREKGNPRTATEILERKDEFLRVIGPVFGRLEGDYIAPTIERCFNIMWRAKQFLPLPESLAQSGIKFEYASPVEQARKQMEAAGAARSLETIMPIAIQGKQEQLLDNYDFDAYIQDTPDTFGFRPSWLRSKEQVAQLRDARAQQAAAQQQMAMMVEGAKVAPGVAKAVETMQGRPAV